LDHIRSRRKHVFAYNELRSPDFFYNIVDFNGDSLLTLLLVFGNRSPKTKHLSSIGVFIKINLFTGTYKEQKWIQNQQTPESKQLQLWCYQLAILQRIQGIGTSPKLGATNLQNVVHELTEANRVAGGERSLSRGDDDGSLLSYADLYPDCDILSNFPVRTGLPVKTLTCRSGTTQFTYN